MTNKLYFFTVKFNTGNASGIDLPGQIEKVRKLLSGCASTAKCIHKFKVTGEARIVLVLEVSDVAELEKFVAGLSRLGSIDFTCKPLKIYEKFAQMLQVDEKLTKPVETPIDSKKDLELFWLDFTVEYPGKSTEELVATWKKEAEFALGAKAKGLHLEPFKVVGERKVQVLVVTEQDAVDNMVFDLPVVKENGNGVTVVCQAIQNLDDYQSRVSKLHKK